MLLSKNGECQINGKYNIANTNVFRCLLLAIWSAFTRIPDDKVVRIVTNNQAIVWTLNEKNITNNSAGDLKRGIVNEFSRMKKVYVCRPISITDESYIKEIAQNAEEGRLLYESKIKV